MNRSSILNNLRKDGDDNIGSHENRSARVPAAGQSMRLLSNSLNQGLVHAESRRNGARCGENSGIKHNNKDPDKSNNRQENQL